MIHQDELPIVPTIPILIALFLSELANCATKSTCSSYTLNLNRLCDFVAKRRGILCSPHNIEHTDIREFLIKLESDGLGISSRSQALSAIRRWLKWMYSNGFVRRVVANKVASPRRPKTLPFSLSPEKIDSMINSVDETVSAWVARDTAILELLYGCGFASSELIRADVGDVNLAGQSVIIHQGDGGEREVPMGDVTAKAVRVYMKERARKLKAKGFHPEKLTRALLLSAGLWGSWIPGREPRLTIRSLDRLVKLIVIKNGLSPKTTPYTLRLDFGLHMFENGADSAAIVALMGFKSDTTMQIIERLSTRELKEVMERTHLVAV